MYAVKERNYLDHFLHSFVCFPFLYSRKIFFKKRIALVVRKNGQPGNIAESVNRKSPARISRIRIYNIYIYIYIYIYSVTAMC